MYYFRGPHVAPPPPPCAAPQTVIREVSHAIPGRLALKLSPVQFLISAVVIVLLVQRQKFIARANDTTICLSNGWSRERCRVIKAANSTHSHYTHMRAGQCKQVRGKQAMRFHFRCDLLLDSHCERIGRTAVVSSHSCPSFTLILPFPPSRTAALSCHVLHEKLSFVMDRLSCSHFALTVASLILFNYLSAIFFR